MAKWAFEENVPRVRPRVRLNRTVETVEGVTEAPPIRDEGARVEAPAAEAPVEHVDPAPEPVAAQVAAPPLVEAVVAPPPAVVVAPPAPVQPAPIVAAVPPAPARTAVSPSQPAPVSLPAAPPPAPQAVAAAPQPRPAVAPPAPARKAVAPAAETASAPVADKAEARKPSAPPVSTELDAETITRRADLRRRSAGLSTAPAPVVPAAALEDPDDFEGAADLAAELERALGQAAEANEQLRRDLGMALDDLARATADSKRQQERADRIEAEARERTILLQDLTRELELLEGERDSALTQASDAALLIEELHEKLALGERRVQELERSLTDAHARTRRIEEQQQAHTSQRLALRAELDAIRRERDEMVGRIAQLEAERDELGKSRRTLDEVHRALSEAKQRAQRIRTR